MDNKLKNSIIDIVNMFSDQKAISDIVISYYQLIPSQSYKITFTYNFEQSII